MRRERVEWEGGSHQTSDIPHQTPKVPGGIFIDGPPSLSRNSPEKPEDEKEDEDEKCGSHSSLVTYNFPLLP